MQHALRVFQDICRQCISVQTAQMHKVIWRYAGGALSALKAHFHVICDYVKCGLNNFMLYLACVFKAFGKGKTNVNPLQHRTWKLKWPRQSCKNT